MINISIHLLPIITLTILLIICYFIKSLGKTYIGDFINFITVISFILTIMWYIALLCYWLYKHINITTN